MRIELAIFCSMPWASILVLVTNKSSPTSCTRFPKVSDKIFQPSQSSSAMPSSIEIMGYFSHQLASKLVKSWADKLTPPSPSRWRSEERRVGRELHDGTRTAG